MRRKWVVSSFAALSLVCCLFSAVQAKEGGIKPFASFDYYGVGNLAGHNSDDGDLQCIDAIANGGVTACSHEEKDRGSMGLRGGVMFDLFGMEVGPSVGYLHGGPTKRDANYRVTPAGSSRERTRNDSYRFLAEARKQFPIGDSGLAVAANAGLGMAFTKEQTHCSDGGSLAGNACGPYSDPTLGYATWEFGPAVLFKGAEFALKYVGFSRGGISAWTTYVISTGYRF